MARLKLLGQTRSWPFVRRHSVLFSHVAAVRALCSACSTAAVDGSVTVGTMFKQSKQYSGPEKAREGTVNAFG